VIRARADRWFDRYRRTGDPRALAQVFDCTAAELWRVAAHVCRDRHLAVDAVQGTLLAAIKHQHDWDRCLGLRCCWRAILGNTSLGASPLLEREIGLTGPDGHWREGLVETAASVRAVQAGGAASLAVVRCES
jgi:hypothetical protein